MPIIPAHPITKDRSPEKVLSVSSIMHFNVNSLEQYYDKNKNKQQKQNVVTLSLFNQSSVRNTLGSWWTRLKQMLEPG